MKTIYTDSGSLNLDGAQLSAELYTALNNFFTKYAKEYSVREISHLVMLTSFDLEVRELSRARRNKF